MKKIICFIPYFAFGGAEKAALNLCNYLSEKYEVIIIVLNKKNLPINLINKNLKIISLKKNRLFTSIFNLSYYVFKLKPNYFISFLYGPNVIATIAKLISFSSTKLIFGVQNNFSQSLESAKSFRTLITLYLFKLSTLFSYKIVACSYGLKKEIKKIIFNKKQIYYAYNPIIDRDFYSRSYKFDKDLLKFNKNYINILSIGRFEKQKNLEFLLRSFKKLNRCNQYKLFLIGDGTLSYELKSLTQRLNLKKYVNFLGQKKNVNVFLRKSDYFVLSSNWEGFGNVLVEALFFNNKVISSDCDFGPSEILKKGKLGKLYEKNNFIDFENKFLNFRKRKPIFKSDLKNYYSSEVAKRYIDIIENKI